MHDDTGMVRSLFVLVLLVACCCVRIRAQTVSAASHVNAAGPNYDVATVKVNDTGSGSPHIDISGGILQMTDVPLGKMLETAFDIQSDQIVGY